MENIRMDIKTSPELQPNPRTSPELESPPARPETILAVHGDADGYWYIGAGRSIAEGPYRDPEQLLSVASDLLSTETRWRIDVFDVAGQKIISYSSENLRARDLDPARHHGRWSSLGATPSQLNERTASGAPTPTLN
jgi:hypothetical protein